MPGINAAHQQYRMHIGNHSNWQARKQSHGPSVHERLQQLANQPGRHASNRHRQMTAQAGVRLFLLMSMVHNTMIGPAISFSSAGRVSAERRLNAADQNYLQHQGTELTHVGQQSKQHQNRLIQVRSAAKPVTDMLSHTDSLVGRPVGNASTSRVTAVLNEMHLFMAGAAGYLYQAGQFIALHDPLQLPQAEATPVCASPYTADDFVHFLNLQGVNVLARGLDQLKCIDKDKYFFFKATVFNARKILQSAIKHLADPKNDELDTYLKHYGFIHIKGLRKALCTTFRSIRRKLNDVMTHNRESIYYGYVSADEPVLTDALTRMNDKNHRFLVTNHFFGKCTVNAANVLIHEMCHFHNKFDFFYIEQELACVTGQSSSEIPSPFQLENSADLYTKTIKKLADYNIASDEQIASVYHMDRSRFLTSFNTNKTFRETAVFLNADTISLLAVALGNYGFKVDNIMPLVNTASPAGSGH